METSHVSPIVHIDADVGVIDISGTLLTTGVNLLEPSYSEVIQTDQATSMSISISDQAPFENQTVVIIDSAVSSSQDYVAESTEPVISLTAVSSVHDIRSSTSEIVIVINSETPSVTSQESTPDFVFDSSSYVTEALSMGASTTPDDVNEVSTTSGLTDSSSAATRFTSDQPNVSSITESLSASFTEIPSVNTLTTPPLDSLSTSIVSTSASSSTLTLQDSSSDPSPVPRTSSSLVGDIGLSSVPGLSVTSRNDTTASTDSSYINNTVSTQRDSENTRTLSTIDNSSSRSDSVTTLGPDLTFTPNSFDNLSSLCTLGIYFKGDCLKLQSDQSLLFEFSGELLRQLSFYLNASRKNIRIGKLVCSPMSVDVQVKQVGILCDGNLVQLLESNTLLLKDDQGNMLQYNVTTINFRHSAEDMAGLFGNLGIVDVVVLSVASLLFAFLCTVGFVFLCRECYKRQRRVSFHLKDSPLVGFRMADFTLMKIPRPKMKYCGNIVQESKTHAESLYNNNSMSNTALHTSGNREQINVRRIDHKGGLLVGVTKSYIDQELHVLAKAEPVDVLAKPLMERTSEVQDTCGTDNPAYVGDDEKVKARKDEEFVEIELTI